MPSAIGGSGNVAARIVDIESNKSSTQALPLGLRGLEVRIKAQVFSQLNLIRAQPQRMAEALKALKASNDRYLKKQQADAIGRGIERGKNQLAASDDQEASSRKTNAHTLDQWVRSNQGPRQERRSLLLMRVADTEISKAVREFSTKPQRNPLRLDNISAISSAISEHVDWIVDSNKGKISHARPERDKASPTARAGHPVAENLSMLMERVGKQDLNDPAQLDKLANKLAAKCLRNQSLDLSEFLTGLGHRRHLFDIPANRVALAVRAVSEGTFTRFVVGFNLYE